MFNPGQDCCPLPTPHCYNSLFAVLDENYNRIPYISGQLQTDQKPIGRYAPCALSVTIDGIANISDYNNFCGDCASMNRIYTVYQTQKGGLSYRGTINNPESNGNNFLNITFATQGNKIICIGSIGGYNLSLSGYPGDYYNYGANIDSNVNGATLDVNLSNNYPPTCPRNQLCDYTGLSLRVQGGIGDISSFNTSYFNLPNTLIPYPCNTLTLSLSGITSKDSLIQDQDLSISGCKQCENLNGTNLVLREFGGHNTKIYSKQLQKYSNVNTTNHPKKICDNYGVLNNTCTNLGMDLDYITLQIIPSSNLTVIPPTITNDLYLKFYGDGDTTTPLATFKETLPTYTYTYLSGVLGAGSICCSGTTTSLYLELPCLLLAGTRNFTMIQESTKNRCNFTGMIASIGSPDTPWTYTDCDSTNASYPVSSQNTFNPFIGSHLSSIYGAQISGLTYTSSLFGNISISGSYSLSESSPQQVIITNNSGIYQECTYLGISSFDTLSEPYLYWGYLICTSGILSASDIINVLGQYTFSWNEDSCGLITNINFSGFVPTFAGNVGGVTGSL